jgi:hypothetical protein
MDSAVKQMIQGKGFIIEDGKFKDTASLAPERWATIVSKILDDKIIMRGTCLIKLNNAICNVEMSDEFGQWMTVSDTASIHMSLPIQLFYNMAHPNPFVPLAMQEFSAAHDSWQSEESDWRLRQ